MLGISFSSPPLTLNCATRLFFGATDLATTPTNSSLLNVNLSGSHPPNVLKGAETWHHSFNKWPVCSSARTANITLNDQDRTTWEASRHALSAFSFSVEQEDKILGKAFGHIHSPYWSEERKVEIPRYETVNEILEYLRSLSLSDDDLLKVLKKFPEVLGCNLEHELKSNVKILEKDWGIEGKSLRKLLLRNPKVLGYNVDCRGDCMAKCTRCWVRF